MNRRWPIPRRTFLKGVGTTIALPVLEAMSPTVRLVAENPSSGRVRGAPLRMAFVYVPNGANMADWTPHEAGADFTLPSILEPLEGVRSDVQVFTGLAQDRAFPNGDGAGDHARASATFLTGCQARKTAGADIRVGISVDQVAAAKVGGLTRLPSLELSCDQGQQAGACDSGYSCAYQYHISWRSESTPNPVEVDPRQVFERLFGNGLPGEMGEARARRQRDRRSILDFVLDDTRRLEAGLGKTDRLKLDEYLTSVRELEARIENAERLASTPPNVAKPTGIPKEYAQHMDLLFDLLVLAFQTDTTRVATFILAFDGSNRSYPAIGVPEGHHDLSHHQGNEDKKQRIAKINRFHVTRFAAFLEKLRSIREGQDSLLDHCMIVYGSGISDGNSHQHDNLPVLLAGGRAGGILQPGRHVKLESKVPMTNLYLAMLERMGAKTDRLGDSSGTLANI